VEAVFAALPVFEARGDDAVAAPEGGEGDFTVAEFFHGLSELGLEEFAGGDDLALRGDPCADLAAARAAQEIGGGLGGADFLRAAADADLPGERFPEKMDRDAGVRGDLGGLGAVEIGEKDEAFCVVRFQEHHTLDGGAVGADGGEGHGVRLGEAGGDGLTHPEGELCEGVGIEVALVQARRDVFTAEGVEVRLRLRSGC